MKLKEWRSQTLNCITSRVCETNPLLNRNEKSLYTCWLKQSFSQSGLTTVDSRKISIVSPGKRNDSEGPDFSDALIMINGEFLHGNVEIHIRSTDWYLHKHHTDPVYDSVILHVVSVADTGRPILTSSGKTVPTLVLPTPFAMIEERPFLCEKWKSVDWTAFVDTMNNYAKIRFQRKCQSVQSDLLVIDPEPYFYLSLLDVLGFSKNRESFRILAEKLPITRIYQILGDAKSENRLVTLESLLYGTSGFLGIGEWPTLVTDAEYISGLRRIWKELKRRYAIKSIPNLSWHFAGIRPANHPTRRLAALAQILMKFFPKYPGQAWINQISGHADFDEIRRWASNCFQQPEGLWKNHLLFSSPGGNLLIGDRRLMDLFSNLLLPFAWAIGSVLHDLSLAQRATDLAKCVPPGEISANIEKMITRLSIEKKKLNNNYLIQGVLEYTRRFCDLNLCELCMLEKYAVR
ncbi:MAG: hypothetical protein COT43_07315 [Candidatus Marinimicrobia bacterium CG08_land_8_20_14_0_20_45_22]|nr:MAG: hypothetical protein COT43_07315 [Candidatus Marinimicrobia bacterium CG08_land_8_20_14_0_20_45_22]